MCASFAQVHATPASIRDIRHALHGVGSTMAMLMVSVLKRLAAVCADGSTRNIGTYFVVLPKETATS
jgi:hypothetical protein